MTTLQSIIKDLKKLADPRRAKVSQRFFKTGKGEYGEGDIFLGITVPEQRRVAKAYKDASFTDIATLLKSSIHEYRFTALEILVMQYDKADSVKRKKIVAFYLKHTRYINNWDLVDTSVEYILGANLIDNDKKLLYTMAHSKNIWERRMSIIATFHFIKHGQFTDTIKIAQLLLTDTHDLIHKAVGWMLREVGNRDLRVLIKFLDQYTLAMPRTMLRYAIEKLPSNKRMYYLKLKK